MAIWAKDSNVLVVKEAPGTRQEARSSPHAALKRALLGSARKLAALYSFIIAVLPFFNPPKDKVATYESKTFAVAESADIYMEAYENDKVWHALIYFATLLKFSFRPELAAAMNDLAAKFVDSRDANVDALESSLAGITTAIEKYRPPPPHGQPKMSNERAAKTAKDLVNVMLIEYAREYDKTFDVRSPFLLI
jgi:hypothetical protein